MIESRQGFPSTLKFNNQGSRPQLSGWGSGSGSVSETGLGLRFLLLGPFNGEQICGLLLGPGASELGPLA